MSSYVFKVVFVIRKVLLKLLFSPDRVVKKYENINVDPSTILTDSVRFRLSSPNNIVTVGSNNMLSCQFVFESQMGLVEIGDNCFINSNTHLISRDKITIGSYVTIAWGCTIYDHNSHSLDYLLRRRDIEDQLEAYRSGKDFISNKDWSNVKSSPISIKDDVWIGMNCIILKGVTIGEGAIVSAGSVVRENVPPWTIVAGNPAVVVKRLK